MDHKTGEELAPKQTTPKEEAPPPTPAALPDTAVAVADKTADPLLADFTLSKSEEFLLQQNLLNIPLDDKFILQQQIDFINGKCVVVLGGLSKIDGGCCCGRFTIKFDGAFGAVSANITSGTSLAVRTGKSVYIALAIR